MLQCPQCNKTLLEMTRQCPSCRADLDLLVDYVNGLKGSLSKAEQLTRAGHLSQAVWAYLEILEVDPDNTTARSQVGQIATAVRQFDRSAPERRWAQGLPSEGAEGGLRLALWTKAVILGAVVLMTFGFGYLCGGGYLSVDDAAADPNAAPKPLHKDSQMGPGR